MDHHICSLDSSFLCVCAENEKVFKQHSILPLLLHLLLMLLFFPLQRGCKYILWEIFSSLSSRIFFPIAAIARMSTTTATANKQTLWKNDWIKNCFSRLKWKAKDWEREKKKKLLSILGKRKKIKRKKINIQRINNICVSGRKTGR